MKIGLPKETEPQFFPPRSCIERDRYVDQSEADAALPNRSCHTDCNSDSDAVAAVYDRRRLVSARAAGAYFGALAKT